MKRELVTITLAMHPLKAALWKLGISGQIESSHTYREIGAMVGEEHPQQIKHHLDSLVKMGAIDYVNGSYKFPVVKSTSSSKKK